MGGGQFVINLAVEFRQRFGRNFVFGHKIGLLASLCRRLARRASAPLLLMEGTASSVPKLFEWGIDEAMPSILEKSCCLRMSGRKVPKMSTTPEPEPPPRQTLNLPPTALPPVVTDVNEAFPGKDISDVSLPV